MASFLLWSLQRRQTSGIPARAGIPPGKKRPPTYPAERAYPCCLPALGEFGMMPPHGGLRTSVGERFPPHQSNGEAWVVPHDAPWRVLRHTTRPRPDDFHRARRSPVPSSAEDSPSGLWRSLGKRVGLTALRGSNPLSSANPITVRERAGSNSTPPLQGFESPILRQSHHRPRAAGHRPPPQGFHPPPPPPDPLPPPSHHRPRAGWVNSTPPLQGFESPILRHRLSTSSEVAAPATTT